MMGSNPQRSEPYAEFVESADTRLLQSFVHHLDSNPFFEAQICKIFYIIQCRYKIFKSLSRIFQSVLNKKNFSISSKQAWCYQTYLMGRKKLFSTLVNPFRLFQNSWKLCLRWLKAKSYLKDFILARILRTIHQTKKCAQVSE